MQTHAFGFSPEGDDAWKGYQKSFARVASRGRLGRPNRRRPRPPSSPSSPPPLKEAGERSLPGGRRAFLLSSRGDPLAEMHRRPWAYSMEAELARSGGGPMGSRRRCGGWRRRIWGFPPQIGSPSGGRARAPSGGPKRWWALALAILLHRSDWGRPKALA